MLVNKAGDFWSIELLESRRLGLVMFSSFSEVFTCFEMLHNKSISGPYSHDYLQVSFIKSDNSGREMLKAAQEQRDASAKQAIDEQAAAKATAEITHSNKKQASSNNQLPKLTCKYEIDYFSEEASRSFLLSKRIIGPKGSNMKKIIEECFQDRPFESDALKLRLRGKGSGFKEGPQNKECNEPLHLCISAKNLFFYERATKLIEQLLVDVSKAFDTYVIKNDMSDMLYELKGANASAVRVYRKESLNGHRPDLMYPANGKAGAPPGLGQTKQNRPKPTSGGQQKQNGVNKNKRGHAKPLGSANYYN